MSVLITTSGFDDLTSLFTDYPDYANQAAALAINQIAQRSALAPIRTEMRKEIAFPTGYLEGDRLAIRQKATVSNLEAVVSGRDRATSLARFAPGQSPSNTRKRPLFVTVKPGQTKQLQNAFLITLRNGNIGLAVRLKPGQELRNSDKAVRVAENLYLLYGPSVDQVFKGVADVQVPIISEALASEFLRQFARLTTNG